MIPWLLLIVLVFFLFDQPSIERVKLFEEDE